MCGIKIRKFIDETKRMIRIENRCRNGSFFMYEVEKCMMFAEMNRTVEEKMVPIGSRISGRLICDEFMDMIVHDSRIVFELRVRYRLVIMVGVKMIHRRFLKIMVWW